VQNPKHNYSTVGNYTVSLIATNTIGSNTVTKYAYRLVARAVQNPVASFISNFNQEMLCTVSILLTKVQDHQLHGTGTLGTEHTPQFRIMFMFITELGNTLLF